MGDFNGNHKGLPNQVYENTLKEIICENLGRFEDYSIEYSSGSSKGDNYLGEVFRVLVKSRKDSAKKLSFIVKLPPQNIARREQFLCNDVFTRESEFYDVIYPMYLKFQEDKGISVEVDGFHHVAKCYKSLTEELNEGLFFEDLKANGFEMFDRMKIVTKEHVLLVMKSLAKMHAIGFCIKDQKPELMDKYRDLKDFFVVQAERKESGIKIWLDSLKKQGVETLMKISKNQDLTERIVNVLNTDLEDTIGECINLETTEPYAVLSHGDCWNNNMMFKYDKAGKAADIRLLDFQIIRYASPVLDLLYYIFGCTRKSLRDKHYQEFLDAYYSELSSFAIKLGSDPDKVFPRDAFDDHLKIFGKFGLIMAIIVLPIFTSDVEDIPDMDELSEKMKVHQENNNCEFDESILGFTSSKTIVAYEERMMEVFQDIYDLNYV